MVEYLSIDKLVLFTKLGLNYNIDKLLLAE
jgi:hypothetical protein